MEPRELSAPLLRYPREGGRKEQGKASLSFFVRSQFPVEVKNMLVGNVPIYSQSPKLQRNFQSRKEVTEREMGGNKERNSRT